jgi:adenosylmethionine-8-amino-7-oxononanoate aminotransferase
MSLRNASGVFHRNIVQSYPTAVSGDGAVIADANGKRYLDGAAGVFVAILGHSPTEIADAVAAQARQLNFAYTGDFTTEAAERLGKKLRDIAPPGFTKLWLTTSGSTANEAAMKLARQYHLLGGNPQKTKIISRWHSYHGSTMGALSMTGAVPRRRPYEPYLANFPHVSPPYCYRCPLSLAYPGCGAACADEIETAIDLNGEQYVSAVIMEPIAGGPLAGLVTPPEYLRKAREICDRHDALLILDEVVAGMGRSGDWFACEESGIVPDIITLAKGLGGGFVPIGAVLVHERVYERFEASGTSFVHGESFTGHALLAAAGSAVIDFIEDHRLLQRVQELGSLLHTQMRALADNPIVGDVRGRGLLCGLELVKDKRTKEPFPREMKVSEQVVQAATRRGVLLLSGNGSVDGLRGDAVVAAPPYVITERQVDQLVDVLAASLQDVVHQIGI